MKLLERPLFSWLSMSMGLLALTALLATELLGPLSFKDAGTTFGVLGFVLLVPGLLRSEDKNPMLIAVVLCTIGLAGTMPLAAVPMGGALAVLVFWMSNKDFDD